MQMGMPRHGLVHGRLSDGRGSGRNERLCGNRRRKVHQMRKMRDRLPQKIDEAHSRKRKGVRCLFQLPDGQRSARDLQKRLHRLRIVQKELPERCNRSAKQSCSHRLFKMHGLRIVRGKMPSKVHCKDGIRQSFKTENSANLGLRRIYRENREKNPNNSPERDAAYAV